MEAGYRSSLGFLGTAALFFSAYDYRTTISALQSCWRRDTGLSISGFLGTEAFLRSPSVYDKATISALQSCWRRDIGWPISGFFGTAAFLSFGIRLYDDHIGAPELLEAGYWFVKYGFFGTQAFFAVFSRHYTTAI